jgi:pilus assembly protein Flp/PilA
MPTSFLSLVKRFAREERGASMVEYSVLIGIITVALIGVVTTLSNEIVAMFGVVNTALGGLTP